MLGWFNGSGPGLVRDAGGSSGWTLRMGDMTINYNDLEDGSHYFAFNNGELTGFNYMSTGGLLHLAGMMVAREYYGGGGSMPAGYIPPNHRPVPRITLPGKSITLSSLPRSKVELTPPSRVRINGNSIVVGGRELNPENNVLRNEGLKHSIASLYTRLILSLKTANFQFQVTGGDRYLHPTLVQGFRYPSIEAFSSTHNSIIIGSGMAHVNGVAVDLRIKCMDNTLVPIDTVRPLLTEAGLRFDANAMPDRYPTNFHYHLVLRN